MKWAGPGCRPHSRRDRKGFIRNSGMHDPWRSLHISSCLLTSRTEVHMNDYGIQLRPVSSLLITRRPLSAGMPSQSAEADDRSNTDQILETDKHGRCNFGAAPRIDVQNTAHDEIRARWATNYRGA